MRGVLLKQITVRSIMNHLQLTILSGQEYLDNLISREDFFRPGLQLTGKLTRIPKTKVHIIGEHECDFLYSLKKEKRVEAIEHYLSLNPPCVIITNDSKIGEEFKGITSHTVPILETKKKTFNLTSELINLLEKELAEEMGIHAVCLNIYGVGILLRGESGIGKSEAALSLLEKGHRLIGDDLVILRKIGPSALIGTHNEVNRDFLALRGIGLVNVQRLYGSGSVQSETKINLDILLNNWDGSTYYDAVFAEEKNINYLGIDVKHIEIPVRPGRDIATLIEVACKNWRLEQSGYKALDEFSSRFPTKIDE